MLRLLMHCTIAVAWAAVTASAHAEADAKLVVIAHRSHCQQLTRDDVVRIFLRQRRHWNDGSPIVPLNHAAASELRKEFSRRVLEIESDRLAEYWNRQYFLGIRPPATLNSDTAVRRYILSDPNAVGYVHSGPFEDDLCVVFRSE